MMHMAIRVGSHVNQNMKNSLHLRVAFDGMGYVIGGQTHPTMGAQVRDHRALQGQSLGGRPFAGFDAGLMVGVDVDEFGIETDGSFEHGDESPQSVRRKLIQRDGDRISPSFVK